MKVDDNKIKETSETQNCTNIGEIQIHDKDDLDPIFVITNDNYKDAQTQVDLYMYLNRTSDAYSNRYKKFVVIECRLFGTRKCTKWQNLNSKILTLKDNYENQ